MFKSKTKAPLFGDVLPEDDEDIIVQKISDEARGTLWAEARLLLRDLTFALMFVALFIVFVVQPVKVEGTSMLPRLHDGERIFVNKLIYYKVPPPEADGWNKADSFSGIVSHGARTALYPIWPRIERGDVVVFWYPNDPDKSYVKRIIGLPGETVEIRNGRILINGQELNEPYLDPDLTSIQGSQPPKLVEKHYYFVMGDNRDNSSDSRAWGLVPEKYIYGKALFRYWPVSSIGVIAHETEYNIVPSSAASGPQSESDTSGPARE